MYEKKCRYIVHDRLVKSVGMLLLFLVFTGVPCLALAAVLTTQTVEGITDVSNEVEQDWKPLELDSTIGTGNEVRTDFSALAELLGEDGSFLEVAEATHLSVLEYDYDQAQKIRIARFAILEGTIIADAAHLDYPTNVFEVETPTVMAMFKFSKAKITVDKDGNTDITLISGKFELLQKSAVRGATRARHRSSKGVETGFSLSENGAVSIETTQDGLKAANLGDGNLSMNIGGQPVDLSPDASFESSLGDDGHPVITNTSDTSDSQVKVGGVLVGTSGELTLSQTEIQPGGSATSLSTPAMSIFEDVNRGSTSSSIPLTTGSGGSTNETPPPGARPPQRRTVRIPVEVVGK